VRPPAPDPFAPTPDETESIAQTVDRLLDARFTELKRPSEPPGAGTIPEGVAAVDLSEVRDLFEQLAANHVLPVRDFLIDLKWGEASREWLGICHPAVRSLRHAADNLDLHELRDGLEAFGRALDAAAAEGTPAIEGTARNALLSAYERLVEILPRAFALDMDRVQRESVIVQSLLLQVPEVRKVTIDKLYAAGISSVSALFSARADELVAAAGIPQRLAERIVEKCQAYRRDLMTASPDLTRAEDRAAIERLTGELARQNEEFERLEGSWSVDATEEKKKLRRARDRTVMQISVVLARLGEVGRLRTIEKLPFARKLVELRAYLNEARERYSATP
jgi:hypothetical protein